MTTEKEECLSEVVFVTSPTRGGPTFEFSEGEDTTVGVRPYDDLLSEVWACRQDCHDNNTLGEVEISIQGSKLLRVGFVSLVAPSRVTLALVGDGESSLTLPLGWGNFLASEVITVLTYLARIDQHHPLSGLYDSAVRAIDTSLLEEVVELGLESLLPEVKELVLHYAPVLVPYPAK